MSSPLIIADAGPLIALAVGNVLEPCLILHGGLFVPQAVLHECMADPSAPGAAPIASAHAGNRFQIVDDSLLAPLDPAFAQGLGTGEIAVLAYAGAQELLAMIDERRARRVASLMNVQVIGTGAVLVQLKRRGLIESVAPVLAAWKAHGYFLAESIRQAILRRACE